MPVGLAEAPVGEANRGCSTAGKKRVHMASWSMTPLASAAEYISAASAAFTASGFSHN